MKNKEPNIWIDHEGAERDRLHYKAISDPTPENIFNSVHAAIDNAHKMTKYIKEQAKKKND